MKDRMYTKEDLRNLLHRIDHKGYPAYKDTRGSWQFDDYTLSIDHVQGDPFASPSSLSLVVPGRKAGFPASYYQDADRRTALEDHLLRLFSKMISYGAGAGNRGEYDAPDWDRQSDSEGPRGRRGGESPCARQDDEAQYSRRRSGNPYGRRGNEAQHSRRGDDPYEGRGDAEQHGRRGGRGAGSGKSGLLATSRPGQEVFSRSACRIDPKSGSVTMRFEAGFPAAGRTILAEELISMLFDILPSAVRKTLFYSRIDQKKLQNAIELSDDQAEVRRLLKEEGLAAFVADGSCLPRASGVSQLPMKDAVLFKSPESLAVTLNLPHRGPVRGMGIRTGVTLIVGGGYHGKSTLLTALERGVYNHIAGDGRELVITDRTAMKIRAEDGRCVKGKDISLFINNLPNGKDTHAFRTEDASGSTSQAAGVAEAMEAGAGVLLIDEDTSATNFMVRDELMARIVLAEMEPITPFISRIRDLYEKSGISTILVAGSSGAYFHVADSVIQMEQYVPYDITAKIREAIGGDAPAGGHFGEGAPAGDRSAGGTPAGGHSTGDSLKKSPDVYRASNYREPDVSAPCRPNLSLRRNSRLKTKVLSEDAFLIGHDEVDVRGLMQIADREQTAALMYTLKYMELHILDGRKTLQQAVGEMLSLISSQGLEVLFDGSYARCGICEIRPQEIFGTLNRYRR